MVIVSTATKSFITLPPRDVASWAARFDPAALPVLQKTAAEIEALRTAEDEVDAHLLAEAIGSDPLMWLKVMAHLARLRRGREGGEPETLTGALVMLGITPFFNAFGLQPTVEEKLGFFPEALEGFHRVLARSRRSARFAIGFAVHRMDRDAPVIHDAALLHDFAELLLWLEAPQLALAIVQRHQEDPTQRSASLQRQVLNVELAELQNHLMRAWRLPALLVGITDDRARRKTPQLANVRLAIRVARHSALGWDNPALPDDIDELGTLLQLSAPHVEHLLLDIDRD